MELNIQQLRLEGLDTELVAVIHDEVIVQTPPALADEVRIIVEQAMIEGRLLSVYFRLLLKRW